MTSKRNPNLSVDVPQEKPSEVEAQSYDWPDPDEVRAKLLKILDDVRGIDDVPWKSARLSLYRLLYVQLTMRLPDDEGEQLRSKLEEEIQQLEAA